MWEEAGGLETSGEQILPFESEERLDAEFVLCQRKLLFSPKGLRWLA